MQTINDTVNNVSYKRMNPGKIFLTPSEGDSYSIDVLENGKFYIVEFYDKYNILIDNYLFQPFIYSNSVKVHPLEIFIVFLFAGQISGMFGMLVAIPFYTVVRTIAREFFGYIKPVRALTEKE